MPDPFMTLGRFTLSTYTALLALGVLASSGALALAYRWRYRRPVGPLVDACLGALLGGVLLARAGHVLLHRYYFEIHPDEIIQLSAGGLDWHGALIGGLLGVAIGYAEVQAAKEWFSMDALSNTLNITRSLHAVGLAFGIGFLASIYPAIRASMLQPIDALRHE